MKRTSPPLLACWILESVLPVSYREEMVGDLIEEYGALAFSTSRLAASVWFWTEACRSIPPMMWSLLRRTDWLKQFMNALGVLVGMVMLKFFAEAVIWKLIEPTATRRVVAAPILFLLISAAGGCGLARIRREATIFLALIVMVAVATLIAIKICTVPVPWWYQACFLILGPLSVLLAPALVRSLKAATAGGCAT